MAVWVHNTADNTLFNLDTLSQFEVAQSGTGWRINALSESGGYAVTPTRTTEAEAQADLAVIADSIGRVEVITFGS